MDRLLTPFHFHQGGEPIESPKKTRRHALTGETHG
jgi:hypothetical protein